MTLGLQYLNAIAQAIFVGLNLNNGNYGFCAMTFLFWLPSFTYIMFTNFALIEKEWRL